MTAPTRLLRQSARAETASVMPTKYSCQEGRPSGPLEKSLTLLAPRQWVVERQNDVGPKTDHERRRVFSLLHTAEAIVASTALASNLIHHRVLTHRVRSLDDLLVVGRAGLTV